MVAERDSTSFVDERLMLPVKFAVRRRWRGLTQNKNKKQKSEEKKMIRFFFDLMPPELRTVCTVGGWMAQSTAVITKCE